MSRAGLLLVCLAVLAGCGSDGGGAADPGAALADTASKLGEIHSGELELRLLVDPREEGGDFGFELTGPFQLTEDGELEKAEIEYTQIADDERETVTVTALDDKAYVMVDGTAYELSEEQTDRLLGLGPGGDSEGDDSSSGLEGIRLEDWIRNPESSDGDEIGGDDTDRIEADLDVLAAVEDLLTLAGNLGQQFDVDGEDARLLQESVRDAKLEVLTGKKDRLLRRLLITAEFDPKLPEGLESLAEAAGAKLEFELEVANPNEPVDVEAPDDPQPYSELES